MNTREMLLRAVLENPAEDTVRLAYADEIQDDEPERAEFIRVQVKIARTPPEQMRCAKNNVGTLLSHAGGYLLFTPRCRCAACSLARREYKLSHRYVVWDWCRGTPAGSRPVYIRGFVSEIHLPCAAFMAHAEAIFRAHPVVSVVLSDVRLMQSEYVNHLDPWTFAGLWERLYSLSGWKWWHPTKEAASDYLSARCVAYGREKAGLTGVAA